MYCIILSQMQACCGVVYVLNNDAVPGTEKAGEEDNQQDAEKQPVFGSDSIAA
jgi:hypothetical protein